MSDRATVSVLLVEDDASMARLMKHVLQLGGYGKVRHVWTGDQAVAAAPEAEIILLDHQLPDQRGMDILPRLLGRADPPSVIMVTAHGSESLAAAALRKGAEDYLTKDHTLPDLLPSILERVRRNRALRTALAEAERELVHAERLAAAGEMHVTLHHELNNPLMVAMAELDLVLEEGAPPGAREDGIRAARQALDQMAAALRRSADLRRADAVAYAGGLRMIDLAAGSAPVEARSWLGRAVVQHADVQLRRVLSLLLTQAGFTVDRVEAVEDLDEAAQSSHVRLVMLAAGGEATNPLGGFRPADGRTYTLVVLGAEHDAQARGAGADLVVPVPFDPATVVQEIVRVMPEHPSA